MISLGGRVDEVLVGALPGFDAIDGCSLTLAVGEFDRGIEAVDSSSRSFGCELRVASWQTVSGLLEPFERHLPQHRHQYLAGHGRGESELTWIVSTDADW